MNHKLTIFVFVAESALTGRLVVYDVGKKKIGWTDYDCECMYISKVIE